MKPSLAFFIILLLSLFLNVKLEDESSTTASLMNSKTPKSSGVIEVKVDPGIIKLCLLGIPPFTMSLHAFMIYLLFFSQKRSKYTNIFYKLVLTNSLVVIYWGGYFWYMGWCQLLGECPFGERQNIAIATFAQYLFYVCMNMDLLIAFNRFSAVVLCAVHEKVFSNKMGLMYIFIILVVSAVENIHGFKYLMKYYTDRGTFAYLYTPDEETLHIFVGIEMGVVYGVHVVIYILYGWSFISYKRQASMTSYHKKERRLLIQALISGSPCFFMMTFHHIIHFPLMELISGEICVGIDPIVYMWFNREIRADFFEIYGIKALLNRSGRRIIPTIHGTNPTIGSLTTGDKVNSREATERPTIGSIPTRRGSMHQQAIVSLTM